ncbi:hypothetical protein M1M07_06410 [Rhodococcus sp. HM1]|uniref:hypothetical protein n=1 Tax=Rhodococcus sp. HM1 TaxID=2937759 RepID=UPI00200B94F5|nr:hypothetical protein [Rhodococcus sp. HM1]MCK8670747.1 hypothetical protein [Rhodococcus sp. HM1]
MTAASGNAQPGKESRPVRTERSFLDMFVQACNRNDVSYTDSARSARDLDAARRDRD